jgi:tetratricopeptide (TPR) repeat protein
MSLRERGGSVRSSGDAQAHDGGIAVSGMVETLTVNSGIRSKVYSSYLEKVHLIAPPQLLHREEEYDLLRAFCTAADPGHSYMWWRAPAWAGKSAFMSWFVLHPPPGIRIVSFFITARWAGQNDRVAFAEVLIEQLAELLDEPLPPLLTEATREAHLLSMLARAAAECSQQGERLVLIVDGLDEDQGVTTGPDAHSIAALLPVYPAAGMRIVVAGRPNPPVPVDVSHDHPLRNQAVVQVLTGSPHAAVVRCDAQRELKRLLVGTDMDRDVLGLLTSSGGGLSGDDLAELTGYSLIEIVEHLEAVSARTFTSRTGRWRPQVFVYFLGHEELQQQATERLGLEGLREYRRRLHDWADDYRERGWPATTPEYLLRGYFRLLQSIRDVPRMLALATDGARHDQMLRLTGGDAAAFVEVVATQDAILRQTDVDLLAMAFLSIRRRALIDRNSNIPAGLPAVWASIGHSARAEALAKGIANPYHRAQALAAVAQAMAADEDYEASGRLLVNAVQTVGRIASPVAKAPALAQVAKAMFASGQREWAAQLLAQAEWSLRATASPSALTSQALSEVAAAMVQLEEIEASRRLLAEAEQAARGNTEPGFRAQALATVVKAAAVAGELEHAERIAQEIIHLDAHVDAVAATAKALAAAGRSEKARRLLFEVQEAARKLTDPHRDALTAVAEAKASVGDVECAIRIAQRITEPTGRSKALAAVASILAVAGRQVQTSELLAQAQRAAETIADQESQVRAFTQVARAAGIAGDIGRAERVARQITDPDWQAIVLTEVAAAMVAAGEPVWAGRTIADAENLARDIADLNEQTQALVALAEVVSSTGQREYVDRLLADAESVARTISNPHQKMQAMAEVANAAASGGDFERAERIASDIFDPDYRAWSLATLAEAVAATGDLDRALRIARNIVSPAWQTARALSVVAEAAARAGSHEQAERLLTDAEEIARGADEPNLQVRALSTLASAAVEAPGRTARLLIDAERMAHSILGPRQTEALIEVANAAARVGDFECSERIITQGIADLSRKAWPLCTLAEALAGVGDVHRAEQIARSISSSDHQVRALITVAKAEAAADRSDRTIKLLTDAEQIARGITYPNGPGWALAAVAEAVAAAGDLQRAEHIACEIIEGHKQAWALLRIAGIAGLPQAVHLIGRAFSVGPWLAPLSLVAKLRPMLVLRIVDQAHPDITRSEAAALKLSDVL